MSKCDACGKETSQIYVVCSRFGPISIGICEECITAGRDSYDLMVSYIGCAGKFPDDINEMYKEVVRKQLDLHGKTEGQFIKDVDDMSKELMEAMKDYEERTSNKSESVTGSDNFS